MCLDSCEIEAELNFNLNLNVCQGLELILQFGPAVAIGAVFENSDANRLSKNELSQILLSYVAYSIQAERIGHAAYFSDEAPAATAVMQSFPPAMAVGGSGSMIDSTGKHKNVVRIQFWQRILISTEGLQKQLK